MKNLLLLCAVVTAIHAAVVAALGDIDRGIFLMLSALVLAELGPNLC